MAYNDLLEEEGISSQYLAILEPRRFVSSWANPAGTLYTASFDYGQVASLSIDGVLATAASSSALLDGDWFFDFASNEISFDDGVTDPSAVSMVASYELYIGTFDAHFFLDPLDTASRVVYYEPLIVRAPTVKQSNTDLLFGFLPSQSSSITLSNATSYWQRHVYDSSFNRAPIKLYHYLDKLEPANIKLLFTGFCGSLDYSYDEMSLDVFDDNFIFDSEFRNLTEPSFYATADFPDIDPSAVGRPVRAVYGLVDNVAAVNIDYGTAGTNKDFAAFNDNNLSEDFVTAVKASPAPIPNRIYVNSVEGINIEDRLVIDDTAADPPQKYYIRVADVDRVGFHKSIFHSGFVSPTGGSEVRRAIVGNVRIIQDGITYLPSFGRDYTVSRNGAVVTFTLDPSIETNIAMARAISSFDQVFCRCYGPVNEATIAASPFGSNSTTTANLTNPIVLIYELLKRNLGLPQSQIETADFIALEATVSSEYGYSVPAVASSNFPSIRDLVTYLLSGELLRLIVNDSGKYTLAATTALGAADKTTGDDEILAGSPSIDMDYSDVVSDVIVEYRGSELTLRNTSNGQLNYISVRSSSDVAKYLHSVKKQRTIKTPHFIEADAQNLADRTRFILGDRIGRFIIKVKNRFFDTEIGDVIEVSIDKLPGFEYQRGTPRTRAYRVLAWDKSLNEITVTLDDQKGVEDNSGSF